MLLLVFSYDACDKGQNKMKIQTITIHNVPNFGSVLQTLATQILFEKKHCEIETIDYCPPRLKVKNRVIQVFKGRGSLLKKIVIFLTMDVLNKYIFASFLKKRVKMTSRVYGLDEMESKLSKPDLYLTGSDQVWNSEHNQFINPVYYFENLKGKKASFSSSFGRSSLPESEKELIIPLLTDYELLSVREDSGKRILQELFPQKDVTQLLDPTLLISAAEWRCLASHSKDAEKTYILIYPMSGIDCRLFDIAKDVSRVIGLPIVMLSPGLKKYKQCDKTLNFQSPERFIELIDNAACVVTNSFHGTAFSINLETPFISLMPQKFSTRLQSLLALFNLTDRIWDEKFDYSNVLSVDFSESRKILEKEREKASLFIDKLMGL